ncbi:MAG: hypothetical protein IPJ58_16340 [Ardenticatenia bacterium]|nr:hypothetical protein [Ardenticatenia bacterium]
MDENLPVLAFATAVATGTPSAALEHRGDPGAGGRILTPATGGRRGHRPAGGGGHPRAGGGRGMVTLRQRGAPAQLLAYHAALSSWAATWTSRATWPRA